MRISARPAAALTAAAMAATAVVGITSTAAHADTAPVDVVSVTGSGAAYTTNSPVGLKISVATSGDVAQWYVESAQIYRGSTLVGTVTDPAYYQGKSVFGFSFKNSWGRGTFTVRNAVIHAYASSSSMYPEYTDSTIAGSFTIKSASDGNLSRKNAIKVISHGKKKSFTVGLRYLSTSGWKPWKGHVVAIQEKTHGHWKTLKHLRLSSKGQATWSRRTGTKYAYRLTTASTSTIYGGSSHPTPKL